MKFKCEKCNKQFDDKYAYDSHLNRKTPCVPVIEPDPNAEFSCIHCGRPFSYRYTLNRHQDSCKMKKSKLSLARRVPIQNVENVADTSIGSNNSTNAITLASDQNQASSSQKANIEGNSNTLTNTTNNNNTTNNITNNFYIN